MTIVSRGVRRMAVAVAVTLQVYPPDQRAADHAFWSATACVAKGQTNFLRVRVIAPGIGVRGSIG